MDKKQNILNKRSFEQAGKDLLRKVHDAESDNLLEALASWKVIEVRTTQPRTLFRLRSRYILSVAASIAVFLSVGLYFWMDTKSDTSMSLALLENNTSSLADDEIVLIESDDKMQLKDESSIKYDMDGKSNAEQHVVKKEITEEKKYTADMSREIACNRALAQYVQENKKTVSILMSEYGDPNFLKEWHIHVKKQVLLRLEKDHIPINHDIEDMVEFAINRVFDTILQNLDDPFDEVFKALNIMDKFMLCLVVSTHYSRLKL